MGGGDGRRIAESIEREHLLLYTSNNTIGSSSATNPSVSRVLVIDQDSSIVASLSGQLAESNITLEGLTDPLAALPGGDSGESGDAGSSQADYDFYLIALDLKPIGGLTLIQKLRQRLDSGSRRAGYILMVDQDRHPEEEALLAELGNIEVVAKPVRVTSLIAAVEKSRTKLFHQAHYRNVRRSIESSMKKAPGKPGGLAAKETLLKAFPALGTLSAPLVADVFERTGEATEGMELINQLRRQEPLSLAVINAGARLLLNCGKLEEAAKLFEILDKIAPNHIERLTRMVDVYLALRRPADGVRKMREILALSPEKPELKFDFFDKLWDAGFQDEAKGFAGLASGIRDLVAYYNNKGVLAARGGQAIDAMALYSKALSAFPGSEEMPKIRFNIALSYLQESATEGLAPAKEQLLLALKGDPEFVKAKSLMSKIEKRLNGATSANAAADSYAQEEAISQPEERVAARKDSTAWLPVNAVPSALDNVPAGDDISGEFGIETI